MATEEDMRNELVAMQMQANQMTNKTLESTRRMVDLTVQTQDVGLRTLKKLDMQGEQLENVEKSLELINKDMRVAEENLQSFEKCCGLCICPWNKIKTFERRKAYQKTWNKENDGQVISNQPVGVKVQSPSEMAQVSGNYIERITNDEREDEMEDNLAQVDCTLSNLRHMAIDMSNEIEIQNRQIDQINKKTESNTERIVQANRKAKKILQK